MISLRKFFTESRSIAEDFFDEGYLQGVGFILLMIILTVWLICVRMPLDGLGIWKMEQGNDEVPFP